MIRYGKKKKKIEKRKMIWRSIARNRNLQITVREQVLTGKISKYRKN